MAIAAAGSDAGDIYVTNALDDDVSVIDPTTNTVTATIDVGQLARRGGSIFHRP